MTRSHWQRPDRTELHAMQRRVPYGTRLRPLAWLMAALLAAAAAPVAAAPAPPPAQPAAHTAVAPQTVNPEVLVTAIAVGDAHSCALLATGGVKCWGDNQWTQIGNRSEWTPESETVPVLVPSLTGVSRIHAGGVNTFALLQNGVAKQWGGGGAQKWFRATVGTALFAMLMAPLVLQCSTWLATIGLTATCARMDQFSVLAKHQTGILGVVFR